MRNTLPTPANSPLLFRSLYSNISPEVKKSLKAIFIRNTIVWYDMGLMVQIAFLLNPLFYAPSQSSTSTMISFFLINCPAILGNFLLSYWGDRYGRIKLFKYTIWPIIFFSFALPFLPTYAQIGGAATFLFGLIRFCQGLLLPGEIISSRVYAVEVIPVTNKLSEFMMTVLRATGELGTIFALLVSSVCMCGVFKNDYFDEYKIPFFLSGFLMLFLFLNRHRFVESKIWVDESKMIDKFNFLTEAKNLRSNLKWLMVLETVPPISHYFVFFFCLNLLKNDYGLTTSQILLHNACIFMAQIVISLFYGFLAIYINPFKIAKVRAIFFVCVILGVFTMMTFYHLSYWGLAAVQICFISLTMAEVPILSHILDSLPVRGRMRFYGISYYTGKTIGNFMVPLLIDILLYPFFGFWGIGILYLFMIGVLYLNAVHRFIPKSV